jgi:ABC-2 type transport system permease protein
MNKTWVVFVNELTTTMKRKGFIVTTLSLPVLGLLGILVFQLVTGLTRLSPDEITRMGFIDQTGIFTQYTEQN